MIRLIVSDLDGTLLDANSQLPPHFFDVLSLLSQRNISFVAASGRTYLTAEQNFSPYSHQLNYICDNGSCVIVNGTCIFETFLNRTKLQALLQLCSSMRGIILSLCGQKSSYHTITKENANHEVIKYHSHYTNVPDLNKVTDCIYKVAIYDEQGAANRIYPILKERFQSDFTLQVSGPYWMDVMPPHTNKGTALSIIQNHLGISPSETMAFGDYYNDIEMLQRADYSFVMKNAPSDMRKFGRFLAPSNADYGVIKTIHQSLLSK